MTHSTPQFQTQFARSGADIAAAQRLRYAVFVTELGAQGDMIDHASERDKDGFDPFAAHLLLRDLTRPDDDQVVGAYRLLDQVGADAAGGFYSETEYDLTPLRSSGRRLLELGRSCLLQDYRGGVGMFHLWSAMAAYVTAHKIDILFGVASFHGTDMATLAEPLAHLHHNHQASAGLRPRARVYQPMDLRPKDMIDRKRAMVATPALLKAYLRLGGRVGEGAFVDHAFNTTDVCMVLDTHDMNTRLRSVYAKDRADG